MLAMKSLKELENTNISQMTVEKYINDNYEVFGKLTFENVNGVCVVNCDGDVIVINEKIEKLTEGFVWGEVKGSFSCSSCRNIKTLEGSPRYVGLNFSCAFCNKIKSLEGSPKSVDGNFDCSYCKNLKTLGGAPEKVGRNFQCNSCDRLKSLVGATKIVDFSFNCSFSCLKYRTMSSLLYVMFGLHNVIVLPLLTPASCSSILIA